MTVSNDRPAQVSMTAGGDSSVSRIPFTPPYTDEELNAIDGGNNCSGE